MAYWVAVGVSSQGFCRGCKTREPYSRCWLAGVSRPRFSALRFRGMRDPLRTLLGWGCWLGDTSASRRFEPDDLAWSFGLLCSNQWCVCVRMCISRYIIRTYSICRAEWQKTYRLADGTDRMAEPSYFRTFPNWGCQHCHGDPSLTWTRAGRRAKPRPNPYARTMSLLGVV